MDKTSFGLYHYTYLCHYTGFLASQPCREKNRRRKWDTGADGTPATTPAEGGASAPIHGSAVDAAKAAAALIAEKLNGAPDKKRKWDVPAAGAR